MNNKKKETNNMLVIVTIIFLSIFIILPPVFRITMKKNANNVNVSTNKKESNTNSKIVALSCKYDNDNYSISSNTSYVNNKITKVSLAYTEKAYSSEENSTKENTTTIDTSDTTIDIITAFNQEKEALTKLIDAEYTNEGFTTKIILNQKTFNANSTDELIIKRFQDFNNQKKYYEGLGYTCQKLSN